MGESASSLMAKTPYNPSHIGRCSITSHDDKKVYHWSELDTLHIRYDREAYGDVFTWEFKMKDGNYFDIENPDEETKKLIAFNDDQCGCENIEIGFGMYKYQALKQEYKSMFKYVLGAKSIEIMKKIKPDEKKN